MHNIDEEVMRMDSSRGEFVNARQHAPEIGERDRLLSEIRYHRKLGHWKAANDLQRRFDRLYSRRKAN